MTYKAGFPALLAALIAVHSGAAASGTAVRITPDIDSITVPHRGQPLRVQRNQDQRNTINPSFQRTSRKCPPFCIQPMRMPNGVETIAEIDMLAYLERVAQGDDSVMIVDSRGPRWLQRGTIPGAVNIHYKKLSLKSAQKSDIAKILEQQFGVERNGELWNFRDAKTLVMFCNGAWCGQSPVNIRALMRIGYPPSKLKWYRGGMQAWEVLGLTTVIPE
jgi:rhodanese-related sulfurtransferase